MLIWLAPQWCWCHYRNMANKKLHPAAETLLYEIEQHLVLTRIDRTKFGIEAMNDGHFVPRLEQGRLPGLDTIDKVRAYMASKTKAVRK
jgi:hypothetical protein